MSIEGFNSNYNILHAAKAFDPIKPALILPEVVDESKWWRGKHSYLDPEGQYVFDPTRDREPDMVAVTISFRSNPARTASSRISRTGRWAATPRRTIMAAAPCF